MEVVKEEPVKKEETDDVQLDDLTAPAPDAEDSDLIEPQDQPDPVVPGKIHPLQPGGKRFEQVYAEAKQAERERNAEREKRIAAEAQLEILKQRGGQPTPEVSDKEYSWAQLEEFIQQGRITRADAEAHREEVTLKKLSQRIKQDFTSETKTAQRSEALSSSILGYVQATPSLTVEGSAERIRLDHEFDWLCSVRGVDSSKLSDVERKELQLTALRATYGPLESVVKRSASSAEPHQGMPGGSRPQRTVNPDQALLNKLTKREVAHYTRMIEGGRYKNGWKDVVAELKYQPPSRGN